MNIHGQKFPEYKRINAAGGFPRQLSKRTVQFADNRPAAAAQKTLLQAMNKSEEVQQLKEYPVIINNNIVQPKMAINDSPALEQEADIMGRKSLQQGNAVNTQPLSTANKSIGGEGVVQGAWVYISGALTNTKVNMVSNSDGTFTRTANKKRYRQIGRRGGYFVVSPITSYNKKKNSKTSGKIVKPSSMKNKIVKKVVNKTGGYNFHMPELDKWNKDSTGIRPETKFGTVSATHKRGAPKISSRVNDFGKKAKVGDAYTDYIDALRSGKKTDPVIAQALLDEDTNVLSSPTEKRGAAMMHSTVNLAEQWRKKGATKIYRAILRRIINGEITFDDFDQQFKFVISADDGRKQVGRLHEVHHEYTKKEKLSSEEQEIFDNMSDIEDEDLSSDDDERERKKDAVKKKRIFSRYVDNN